MWISGYIPSPVLPLTTIKISVCVPWHLRLCLISDNSDGSLERCDSKVYHAVELHFMDSHMKVGKHCFPRLTKNHFQIRKNQPRWLKTSSLSNKARVPCTHKVIQDQPQLNGKHLCQICVECQKGTVMSINLHAA